MPFPSSSSRAPQQSLHRHQRRLPPARSIDTPIIIGYAHDAKSGRAERAIRDGANVIVWSFLHMELTEDEHDVVNTTANTSSSSSRRGGEQGTGGEGRIRTALDLGEIRRIRDGCDESVIHLAAFGGWNGPHPPPTAATGSIAMTGKRWFDVFDEFNEANGYIFDGVDWDYEGHDDLSSPTAQFTLETLDVMADFSVEAKRRGMVVSMAPAESYLDATIATAPGRRSSGSIDGEFSLALNLPPRSWSSDRYHATDEDRELIRQTGFSHAGRQCYAYVLARAGSDTFDWIAVQLYESYSPFAHDVVRRRRTLDQRGVEEALMTRVRGLVEGYTVTGMPPSSSLSLSTDENFSSSSLEYEVKLRASQIVLGIANGWADGVKVCKVEATAVRSAFESTMAEYGEGFLGVMFWTIEEEGDEDDDDARMANSLRREFEKLGRSKGEL
eukprot:CAMPEP_0181134958 /NCGR_PEP_ID=MMETSP1071-20121207/32367_1 /TAXON_ID=35127 /ORGANISM="Thalassiosira sp., Strain NH16" /LENGTH=441 /DNA_ID=CAMNT_0023221515 /DNA_START=408 /DNA_END=1733 /DNA_ORIENTATION=-